MSSKVIDMQGWAYAQLFKAYDECLAIGMTREELDAIIAEAFDEAAREDMQAHREGA